MQSKWQSFNISLGLILWGATILLGIFHQEEILKWIKITPFHMMLMFFLIVFLCVYVVLSLQGFKQGKETKNCKHAYRGLSHSRMKKGK